MPPVGVAASLYATRQQESAAAITLAFEAGCEPHEASYWLTLRRELAGGAASVILQ